MKSETSFLNSMLLKISLVVGFSFLLVACGGATVPQQEDIEVTREEGMETDEQAQTETSEKTLIYVTPSLSISMDPMFLPGFQTAEVVQNIYWQWTSYPLLEVSEDIRVEEAGSGESVMESAILESWEISEDGTEYTMHIRPGVLDRYGNELTAEIVPWHFARLENTPSSFVLNGLGISNVEEQIEVVDDYTFKIKLAGPNTLVLRMLNVNNSYAIGPEVLEHVTDDDPFAYEWLQRTPAELGPYILEEWEAGVQQVFAKNPNYYGPEPDIDRVIYRQVPESSNRAALLLSGDAHIARDLSMDELDRVDQADGVKALCYAGNIFVYGAPNFEKEGPMQDLNVRRALAYAVPYEDIISSVYRDRANRLYGYATEAYNDYLYADGVEDYPYETDFDEARNLLEEAGYGDGLDLNVLVNADFPEHERIAVLLRDSFAEIGVNLVIDTQPGAAFYDLAQNHEFTDLIIGQNYSVILDPLYHASVWFSQSPPPNINWGGFGTDEFREVFEAATQIPAGPQYTEYMHRLQEIVVEEVGWLSFANAPSCWGWSEQVDGYVWHTHSQLVWSELTLEE